MSSHSIITQPPTVSPFACTYELISSVPQTLIDFHAPATIKLSVFTSKFTKGEPNLIAIFADRA